MAGISRGAYGQLINMVGGEFCMKKPIKLWLIIATVVIAVVLFLALAGPVVRVVQEAGEKGKVQWNVKVTALSFHLYNASQRVAVEKLENGEWQDCSVIKNYNSSLSLMPLNYPGKTYTVFWDIGSFFDISIPGRYRVTVTLGRDDKMTDTFTLTREFRVK